MECSLLDLVLRCQPFLFYCAEEGKGLAHCHRASRSGLHQGWVSVNLFEGSRQPRLKQGRIEPLKVGRGHATPAEAA